MQKVDVENQIGNILGDKLQQFVALVKGQGFGPFLMGQQPSSKTNLIDPNLRSQIQPNDISPDYFEYLAAATAAFKAIENPDVEKGQVYGPYNEKIREIYRNILGEKGALPIRSSQLSAPFTFEQLPYSSKLKYLVPGFNILPFDKKVYPSSTDDRKNNNPLTNLILYLYHFVAILDTSTGADARTITTFLQEDNLYFNKYVNGVVQMLTDENLSGINIQKTGIPVDEIYNVVIDATVEVTNKIISELNSLPTIQNPTEPGSINIYKNDPLKTQADIDAYIKKLGSNPIANSPIDADLFALDDIRAGGANADQAFGASPAGEQIKTAGIYNPIYLDDAKVMENIPAIVPTTQPVTAPQVGQPGQPGKKLGKKTQQIQLTGNLPKSLDELYGPEIKSIYGSQAEEALAAAPVAGTAPPKAIAATTDFGKNLITKPIQGTVDNLGYAVDKANLISANSRQLISALATSLKDLYPSPASNYARAHILALARSPIEDGDNFAAGIDTKKIMQHIDEAIAGYNKLLGRLNKIPSKTKNYSERFATLYDTFIDAFSNYSSVFLDVDANGNLIRKGQATIQAPGQTTQQTTSPALLKRSLADPALSKFYAEFIVPKISFYRDFFNLVKGDGTVTELAELNPADFPKYRLNVKKAQQYTPLTGGGMHGGILPGDIILLTLVPDFLPTNNSGIFIRVNGTMKRIPPAEITAYGGLDAIRKALRTIYNSPPGTPSVQVFGSNPISIQQAVSNAGYTRFDIDTKEYLKTLLSRPITSQALGVTPVWSEQNKKLTEQMLKEASKWIREGDAFIKLNDKGEPIPDADIDVCEFLNITGPDCQKFVEQCALSTEEFPEKCKELPTYSNSFTHNTPANTLKEQVIKINPRYAFEVLKKFRFAYYIYNEPTSPVKDFTRYRVQSVGSWLQELLTEVCSPERTKSADPCNVSLLDQLNKFGTATIGPYTGNFGDVLAKLAKDPAYDPFFSYLSVLVDWVNANPQTLNIEEDKFPYAPSGPEYPPVNDSFKTYQYVNPYKQASTRMIDLCNGLARLKTTISSGLNPSISGTIANVMVNSPYDVGMPFNRSAFTSVNPFGPFSAFSGSSSVLSPLSQFGGDDKFSTELQNINEQFGYALFKQIDQNLTETMRHLTSGNKMRYKSATRNDIDKYLESFKAIEAQLRDSLSQFLQRNRLYQASKGHIKAYEVPQDKWEDIATKHSNLLQLNNVYNKKAINLIDIFQAVISAIQGKMGQDANIQLGQTPQISQASTPYYRNLNMGYHKPGF